MESEDTIFFGELLRRFRLRRHLTQQQLAEQIGVHRDSIGSWERGEFHPETPTMVHEIARILDLSEDEKRLFFEALYGTASMLPLHDLPGHNPYFTGRETILTLLHAQLTAGKSVALVQTQAISGLGGIGKTQVAIEYAYRFRQHYHDILWVVADSREMFMTSYQTLARRLRLPEREHREQYKVVEAVKRWLREHKHWLLILDNIEDLSLVQEFVPTPRQGAVVLTTRRAETRPVAEALLLEDLPEGEALLFLLRRAGSIPKVAPVETASADDRAAALALVQIVGGLPLALDQAGAYVAETGCSFSDYLDLFKKRQADLLSRRGTFAYDHPMSVVATFSLAFQQVQQHSKAAIDLLKFCVYLAPDVIPLEIITEGSAHLGTLLEPVANDALQLDQALETLRAYSLVQRDGAIRTLSIHRLVQAVLQDQLLEEERHTWRERAMLAVNSAFPHAEYEAWSQCERMLSQALFAAQSIKQDQMSSKEAERLLYETGAYLSDRARYAEAEPLYQQALRISEQQVEPEHLRMTQVLNNLATLYFRQGKYEEAEAFSQRALRISEQQLGPEHLQVAHSLKILGMLYTDQGRYAEAEPLYQRALRISEQQVEPEHLMVTQVLNNLATLYYRQGRYAEAEPLYQQGLGIGEQQLGPEHPQVISMLNNLATLFYQQSRYTEAEPLWQRVQGIWEQQLGPEHPFVTYPLNNLAEIYRQQGRYAEAEPLYQRALQIRERQFGSEYSGLGHPLNNLATLYREQGRYAEAEALYQRALRIREQQLGPAHLDTAETMHDLARLKEAQSNNEEAKALYARALAIREQVLVEGHPKTVETRKRLSALLHTMGRHKEATQFEQGMGGEEQKSHQEE